MNEIIFEYMKTPLYRYTFQNKRIKQWVENNVKGKVLNLFAGKTVLNCDETRIDKDSTMVADYYIDALEYCRKNKTERYNTVLLDPPYSYRKSMEMYNGNITSPFNMLKDTINDILNKDGIVITFGYHSNSMGKKRGFIQNKILLMSHGGAIHDTIVTIEQKH